MPRDINQQAINLAADHVSQDTIQDRAADHANQEEATTMTGDDTQTIVPDQTDTNKREEGEDTQTMTSDQTNTNRETPRTTSEE